jgi:membrane-bound lytic murein transglycosylase MltF
LRLTARALAGVAGFLQQHILPEVSAAKHLVGEVQTRWAIDTSMSLMANLLAHADMAKDSEEYTVMLPKPPAAE